MNYQHMQELAGFIRENRTQEGNFEKLFQKLQEEMHREDAEETYKKELERILTVHAEVYRQAKASSGSAWPEFERMVSEFEKVVVQWMK